MCRNAIETVQHLFKDCEYIKTIKNGLQLRTGIVIPQEVIPRGQENQIATLHCILNFVVWRERCRRIFQEIDKDRDNLIDEILQQRDDWKNT